MVSFLAWSWCSSDLLNLAPWHMQHACMHCTMHMTLLHMRMRILIMSISSLHNLFYCYTTCVHAQFLQANVKQIFWSASGILPTALCVLAPRVCTSVLVYTRGLIEWWPLLVLSLLNASVQYCKFSNHAPQH